MFVILARNLTIHAAITIFEIRHLVSHFNQNDKMSYLFYGNLIFGLSMVCILSSINLKNCK